MYLHEHIDFRTAEISSCLINKNDSFTNMYVNTRSLISSNGKCSKYNPSADIVGELHDSLFLRR